MSVSVPVCSESDASEYASPCHTCALLLMLAIEFHFIINNIS